MAKRGASCGNLKQDLLRARSPSIGFDGTVYVGSSNKKLFAVNGKSGDKLWEFETGHLVRSSPAIGLNGIVYVGSGDNKLYAIKASSGPTLDSPWPMFGQNARRTALAGDRQNLTVEDPATFELVTGDGDTDNAFFAIEEQTLKLASPLNFEKQPKYSFRIRGTDGGGKFVEKSFVIEVTDVVDESRYSLTLDGRDDLVAVDRRDGQTLVGHKDLTLMSWVKVDADTIQPPSILSIPRNPGEAAVGGPASVFNLSTSLGGKDIPGFRLATGNAEAIDLVGKTPLPQGFWGHLAVTVQSNAVMTLYVNGSVAAVTSLVDKQIDWGNQLNPLYIGSSAFTRGFLPGMLDDVRIYDRVLSHEEVKAVFDANFGPHGSGPRDASLQLHLAFEEGKGASTVDISEKGRTVMMLNGAGWSQDNPGFPHMPVRRNNLGAFIIVEMEGRVIVQGHDGKVLPADDVGPGKLLLQGQTVHTGPQGKITLLLSNGSLLTLKPMTGMLLTELEQKKFVLPATTQLSELETEPSTSNTKLNLGYGDLIFNVKKLNAGSAFIIESHRRQCSHPWDEWSIVRSGGSRKQGGDRGRKHGHWHRGVFRQGRGGRGGGCGRRGRSGTGDRRGRESGRD